MSIQVSTHGKEYAAYCKKCQVIRLFDFDEIKISCIEEHKFIDCKCGPTNDCVELYSQSAIVLY